MLARFSSAQHIAVSLVGALVFSALFVGAAIPVLPIA
jgi:hypothetical protein